MPKAIKKPIKNAKRTFKKMPKMLGMLKICQKMHSRSDKKEGPRKRKGAVNSGK